MYCSRPAHDLRAALVARNTRHSVQLRWRRRVDAYGLYFEAAALAASACAFKLASLGERVRPDVLPARDADKVFVAAPLVQTPSNQYRILSARRYKR